MKIIYLHQYFKLPTESGATRSYDLATGFSSLGYEVEVLAATSDLKYKKGKRWSKVKIDGININYLYLPYSNKMSYLKRSKVFIKFIWLASIKLISTNGDLVIATSTPLTIGIPAIIKKWFHRTNFIFEVRDVWPEVVIAIGAVKNRVIKRLLIYLEALIYQEASAIVVLSSDMKRSIISRYPKISSKPIKVIENISEINRFQNTYQYKKKIILEKIGFQPKFSILYAGTFGRVNGIQYVIDLACMLIKYDPEIVFILVGSGSEKKEIINEAKIKKILNKNVFILDSVPKEELPQLYYECDMGSSFVIPIEELWANSASKFFDTLAASRPILINYQGWQKEVINKENIGYILPPQISDNAVKNFVQYLNNESLLEEQRQNSLKIAEQKYSKVMAIEKYEVILKGTQSY
tara:strand:- start:2617 stop:3840 length:1224 start_codon:yes stop_codon:yes gene_type:complete